LSPGVGDGPVVAVIDYGIGNLRSAEKALQRVGARASLVSDPAEADRADALVLPGVGAFGPCIQALRRSGFDELLVDAIARRVPFLAICIGYQMCYEGSEEAPNAEGLGIFPGVVRELPEGVKHPQMQWNLLRPVGTTQSRMMDVLGPDAWVYFVHSYAPERHDDVVATCEYGGEVVAAAERGRCWGVQFHPEKSGSTGLGLLSGFLKMVEAAPR